MKRLTQLNSICTLIVALGFGVIALPVQSDTLLVDRVDKGTASLPKRGSMMRDVVARFGEPVAKHAPRGGGSRVHPPITRWDYAEFTVYFENNHVVDAVVKRASQYEEGPKPAR